jgi:A/G-specific adenine glycosylase
VRHGATGGSGGPEPSGLPLAALRQRMLAWYATSARELPWRVREGAPDPYAVWVSEVMLQQTRVEVVGGYFSRWMERLPTLEALAAAPQDEVLKLWEGLGYYSRARNLHRAARLAVERHGGVPDDADAFAMLPGVGAYTRGAVASIAFGRREPAVDGNTRRVLARWLNASRPPERELRELAAALVAEGAPGDFNQAMMDLGSEVCRPRAPRCGSCPVEELCSARRHGREEEVPSPIRRPPPRLEPTGVAVARQEGRLLVVRLPANGRLGGTWGLPHAACRPGEEPGDAALRAVGPWLAGGRAVALLPPVEHTFTHVRAVYHPVLVESEPESGEIGFSRGVGGAGEDALWSDAEELEALPFATAMRKVLSVPGVPPARAPTSPPPPARSRP